MENAQYSQIKALFLVHFLVAGVLAGGSFFLFDARVALSLFSGGALAVLAGWHVFRSLRQTTGNDPEQGRRQLLKSALFRYVMALFLLWFCYRVGLALPVVAAGFFVAQLVTYLYFFYLLQKDQRQSELS